MGVIARASVERKTGKFEGKSKIFREIKSVGSPVHAELFGVSRGGCQEAGREPFGFVCMGAQAAWAGP